MTEEVSRQEVTLEGNVNLLISLTESCLRAFHPNPAIPPHADSGRLWVHDL